MPRIKYVCLSDLHLGQDAGLFTEMNALGGGTNPLVPGEVMLTFCGALRSVLENDRDGAHDRPTIILNGDIVELALTTTNVAAMVFQRFFELIMPDDGKHLFDKIIYIPGNHDHHLWETARETQYVEYHLNEKNQNTLKYRGTIQRCLQKTWPAQSLHIF